MTELNDTNIWLEIINIREHTKFLEMNQIGKDKK